MVDVTKEKYLGTEGAIRRNKLKAILDKYFFSISSLAKKVDITRGNLSTLLSGDRPFSDYTANKIEAALDLPCGYLSDENIEDYELDKFFNVKFYEDMKFLVGNSFEKKIKLPREFARKMKLNNEQDILITIMNDDLMHPSIKLNDMLFIDLSQKLIEDNKLYLININGFYKIRRLILDKDIVAVHIDNPDNKLTHITRSYEINDIEIVGKVVSTLSNID